MLGTDKMDRMVHDDTEIMIMNTGEHILHKKITIWG